MALAKSRNALKRQKAEKEPSQSLHHLHGSLPHAGTSLHSFRECYPFSRPFRVHPKVWFRRTASAWTFKERRFINRRGSRSLRTVSSCVVESWVTRVRGNEGEKEIHVTISCAAMFFPFRVGREVAVCAFMYSNIVVSWLHEKRMFEILGFDIFLRTWYFPNRK